MKKLLYIIVISLLCISCNHNSASSDIYSEDADSIIHTEHDTVKIYTSDGKYAPFNVINLTYKFKNNETKHEDEGLTSNSKIINRASTIKYFSTRLITGKYTYLYICNNKNVIEDSLRSNIKYHLSKFDINLVELKIN